MGIQDIIKKSFLSQFDSDLSTTTVMITLLITAAIGIYIFAVYRVTCRKAFYSKSFAISLPVIAMITASIIISIQSSVVISLGMVGALSIVRFRTAIKEPMDLMFLFWSISIGIICGAGLAQVAVILSVVLTLGIFILDRLPVARAPMILVVNARDLDAESRIMDIVGSHDSHARVKSRNMTETSLDLVVEMRTAQGNTLVREVMKLEGILSASLMLAHLGEAKAAAAIEKAVSAVISEGKTLTQDMGGTASTEEFADAVIAKL